MGGWSAILIWVCVLAIPVLAGGLLLLTAAAAMWERRVVWYFVPVNDEAARPTAFAAANPYATSQVAEPQVPPPSVAAATAQAAAQALGFAKLGTFRDAKGATYRVRYDFWLSPERDVLVNVGCGTVMGIAVDARWLYTPLQDGRVVVTVTDQSASEYDPSGQRIEALVDAFTFDQLLAAHRSRVRRLSSPALPFGPEPLQQFRASVTQRVASLVGSGFAKHLDPGQETWSYTLLGALYWAPLANGQALRRSLISDTALGR